MQPQYHITFISHPFYCALQTRLKDIRPILVSWAKFFNCRHHSWLKNCFQIILSSQFEVILCEGCSSWFYSRKPNIVTQELIELSNWTVNDWFLMRYMVCACMRSLCDVVYLLNSQKDPILHHTLIYVRQHVRKNPEKNNRNKAQIICSFIRLYPTGKSL